MLLKADNRTLVANSKNSYLVNSYSSATSTLYVTNTEGFAVDKYVLIGNFGSESAEILKIASVTDSTGALTFKTELGAAATTRFAHSESTKVSVIAYNQVKFYYETTSTFTGNNLLTTVDIQPSDWFTVYDDIVNSTNYGFFRFYNSTTLTFSDPSNAIPYSGFTYNTTKNIIDSFFSLLNNKELKLISFEETMLWLNEGYSLMRNQLNLVNTEYGAAVPVTLNVLAGVSEYLLPADFSDLLSFVDNQGLKIDFIKLPDVSSYTMSQPRYYIRGKYLGLAPTPSVDYTAVYRYTTKAPIINSYDDEIDLPNDAHYLLKDYMVFRAYQKLKYPNALEYFKMFDNSLNRMKVDAIHRSANLDSWGIDSAANV